MDFDVNKMMLLMWWWWWWRWHSKPLKV